jgi:hypothetical protein
MNLAVLVPYRDQPEQNRAAQLEHFKTVMPSILKDAMPDANWRIYIGIQTDDGHKFSRARVLNALVRIIQTDFPECNRIILHDVDLIPDVERARGYVMPMPDGKRVISLNTTGEYATMAGYIGGICAIDPVVFRDVDGFPNQLEGWGGEDDSLRDSLGWESLCTYTTGTVRNLETDPEFVGVGEFVRARHDPRFQMPKEERRKIRQTWQGKRHRVAEGLVSGYNDLLFSVSSVESVDGINTFVLEVSDWRSMTSSRSGRTYYANDRLRITQWERPYLYK